MSSRPESRLWAALQPRLAEDWWADRIENLVGIGFPDVVLTKKAGGNVVYCELKAVEKLPARRATRVFGEAGLRPEQISWIYSRAMSGARCVIVARAARFLFVVNGGHARVFNDWCLEELCALSDWYAESARLTSTVWRGLSGCLLPGGGV